MKLKISFILLTNLCLITYFSFTKEFTFLSSQDMKKAKGIKDIELRRIISGVIGDINELDDKSLINIPYKSFDDSTVTYENNEINVYVKRCIFENKEHKIRWYDDDSVFIKSIDSRKAYGIITVIPELEICEISVIIYGLVVRVPHSAYDDIFRPGLGCFKSEGAEGDYVGCNSYLYHSLDKKFYILKICAGDGHASCEVMWIFRNGKYIGRVINDDLC